MWNKSEPSEDLSGSGTKSWGEGKTSSPHGTQKEPVDIHTKGRMTENENQEERGFSQESSSVLEATAASGEVAPMDILEDDV